MPPMLYWEQHLKASGSFCGLWDLCAKPDLSVTHTCRWTTWQRSQKHWGLHSGASNFCTCRMKTVTWWLSNHHTGSLNCHPPLCSCAFRDPSALSLPLVTTRHRQQGCTWLCLSGPRCWQHTGLPRAVEIDFVTTVAMWQPSWGPWRLCPGARLCLLWGSLEQAAQLSRGRTARREQAEMNAHDETVNAEPK